jgi:hypothetical protein
LLCFQNRLPLSYETFSLVAKLKGDCFAISGEMMAGTFNKKDMGLLKNIPSNNTKEFSFAAERKGDCASESALALSGVEGAAPRLRAESRSRSVEGR